MPRQTGHEHAERERERDRDRDRSQWEAATRAGKAHAGTIKSVDDPAKADGSNWATTQTPTAAARPRGVLVTFEGIDGSGKTTAVENVSAALESDGEIPEVFQTQEPSNEWTGPFVRNALSRETGSSFVDFFAFMADRAEHTESLIRPALKTGGVVLSDRYADSTRVYQPPRLAKWFVSRTATELWIESAMSPWSIEPDLTLYIDVTVDTALSRIEADGGAGDKYENRGTIESARSGYERLYTAPGVPGHVRRVNGELPPEKVASECVCHITALLQDRGMIGE